MGVAIGSLEKGSNPFALTMTILSDIKQTTMKTRQTKGLRNKVAGLTDLQKFEIVLVNAIIIVSIVINLIF